ncbi:MAG TPA: hypothetical protein VKA41_06635 [Solirubrobacterales bacterium]|nr:hypothetical protein [Solirubrobacterales bacterium]
MTGSGTATIGGNAPIPPPGWARPTDRIVARLRARSIDDKLLRGAADGSPVVLVRRARLVRRRYRARVAASLRRLIDAARRSQMNLFSAKLPLKVDDVLASAPLILTLADELEREESVSPRGVILADRLVTDGDSPVYGLDPIHHPPEETVESTVKRARAALHLG